MTLPQATLPDLTLKAGTDRSNINATEVITVWLSKLQDVVDAGDVGRRSELFFDDSWWRDLLALTWEFKSLHGEKVADSIKQAQQVKLGDLKPVSSGVLVPQIGDMGPFTLVESAFTFTTKFGSGSGYLRLGNTGPDEWKAWVILTNLKEIKGHEEMHNLTAPPSWSSSQDHESYEASAQENPRVIVIGAGHSGLSTVARLKQLGVSALLVDKLPRIGDSWRRRYMNLTLHDPVWENHMPYLKFPETFPTWIPRKQIADWLEHYQQILQLPIRMGTSVKSARWNADAKNWTVVLEKDGSVTEFKPAHVVIATGAHGEFPHIPDFEGMNDFTGPKIHSTEYTTAADVPDYKSKKWIVIGSSSSGHDVAYDLAKSGADVTMVQRDANMIYSLNSKVHVVGAPFMKPGISTPDADILLSSLPFPVAITLMVGGTQMIYQMDKEILDRVAKTEFKYLDGADGRGYLHLVLKKGGGHYPDQGSLELIANETIKVKQCYDGIKRLTSKGVVLADGREIEGDAIVFATGYAPLDFSMRKIFVDDVAAKFGAGLAFTKDNELNGLCTTPGHPGLWWIAGSFAMNRAGSLNLALQIKAVEAGLNPEHYDLK